MEFIDRQLADDLAAALYATSSSNAVLRLPELRDLIGKSEPRASTPIDAIAAEPRPRRIGVWESVETGNRPEFRRTYKGDGWRHWADVDLIPAKGDRPRVVVIGESVARGYLCEPHFNPVLAARRLLEASSRSDTIEIVDLARNGLDLN